MITFFQSQTIGDHFDQYLSQKVVMVMIVLAFPKTLGVESALTIVLLGRVVVSVSATIANIEAFVQRRIAPLMQNFLSDLEYDIQVFQMKEVADPVTCEEQLYDDRELQSVLDRFLRFRLFGVLIDFLRDLSNEFLFEEDSDSAIALNQFVLSLEDSYQNELDNIESEIR
jgi:hypothetical protein